MKTISLYCTVLLITVSISSCCHGYWVALQNTSDTDKAVKVLNVKASDLQYREVMHLSNVYRPFVYFSRKRNVVPIIKDSAGNNYSFVLPGGRTAYIKAGLGGPEMSPEYMIINKRDTIPMSGNGQTIRKDYWLTYTTSYTNIIK